MPPNRPFTDDLAHLMALLTEGAPFRYRSSPARTPDEPAVASALNLLDEADFKSRWSESFLVLLRALLTVNTVSEQHRGVLVGGGPRMRGPEQRGGDGNGE